jgi:hypothetical protein
MKPKGFLDRLTAALWAWQSRRPSERVASDDERSREEVSSFGNRA